MKIIFVHATMNTGGAERTIAHLSNYFVKEGHEVVIRVMTNSEPEYYINNKIKYIKNNNLISKNVLDAIKNNIIQIKKLNKILKEEKPDRIVCFSITSFFLALVASTSKYTKIIYCERSNPYKSMHRTFWKKMKKPLSLFADGCVFQTERAKLYYPKQIYRKSIIIPNPVYPLDYINIPDEYKQLKKISSVGRLVDSKGFDILIKAFSLIHLNFPDYKLYIYGEGNELSNLLKLVNKLSLNDFIVFAGNVNDVNKNIYDSALFVLPSRDEGMPNALMEAMACGLPCISTDCEMGPRELINNNENGILVPVDQEKELANAIKMVLLNKNFSQELGENAKKIRETNDIQIIGKKFLDFIEGV